MCVCVCVCVCVRVCVCDACFYVYQMIVYSVFQDLYFNVALRMK